MEEDIRPQGSQRRKLGRRGAKKTRLYTVDVLRMETDSLGRRFFFTPDENMPVCGRMRKKRHRSIEREACLAVPTPDGPCRVHGAGGGRPLIHGRYSKALKAWRSEYQKAVSAPDITSTVPELGLMDVAISKLAERVEEADCPSWRAEVLKLFETLEGAIRARNLSKVGGLMKELGDLLRRGARSDQVAHDLIAVLDKRANRANRMEELRIRAEEKITVGELTRIFGLWIALLEQRLDAAVFRSLVPHLRAFVVDQRLAPGTTDEANGSGLGLLAAPKNGAASARAADQHDADTDQD